MKATCDLCNNKKYIGFIVYDSKKIYRLCKTHYDKYIISEIDVDKYISSELKKYNKNNNQNLLSE